MASIKQRLLEIQATSLATAQAAKQLIAELDNDKPVTDKQRRKAEIEARIKANMNKNVLRQLNRNKAS